MRYEGKVRRLGDFTQQLFPAGLDARSCRRNKILLQITHVYHLRNPRYVSKKAPSFLRRAIGRGEMEARTMRGAREHRRTVGHPPVGGSGRFTLEIIAVQPGSPRDGPGRTRGGRSLPGLISGGYGTAVRSRVTIL